MPEPVINVSEQLNHTLEIIAVTCAEVSDSVSDLNDFLQLRLPDRPRRQERLEEPPFVQDDPAKLFELRVA